MKNFLGDFNANRKVKLNDRVEFPELLDMKPWTKEGLAQK